MAHATVVGQPTSSHPTSKSSTKSLTKSFTQPPLVFGARKFSDARQDKATALLTKFIVSNMLPLSLVDDDAFREFISFLEPEYRIPCRQTFTARLDGVKAKLEKTVQEEMDKIYDITHTDLFKYIFHSGSDKCE